MPLLCEKYAGDKIWIGCRLTSALPRCLSCCRHNACVSDVWRRPLFGGVSKWLLTRSCLRAVMICVLLLLVEVRGISRFVHFGLLNFLLLKWVVLHGLVLSFLYYVQSINFSSPMRVSKKYTFRLCLHYWKFQRFVKLAVELMLGRCRGAHYACFTVWCRLLQAA